MTKVIGVQAEFRLKRAQKISTAMLNKAWTQAKLAERAGHDVRTIRDLVHGKPISSQVVVNVCQALGIEAELADPAEAEIEVSEPWYGSYAREPYKDYEGAFFSLRRSFTYPDQFIRSVFEIKWHESDWIFVFQEHQSYVSENDRKVDHSQKGEVYISQFTDLIHLVTVNSGAVRTITLTKMRGSGLIMRGTVLTQAERSVFFQPSVSAIYLYKIKDYDFERDAKKIGAIKPGDDEHRAIKDEIERIEKDVMLVAGPLGQK